MWIGYAGRDYILSYGMQKFVIKLKKRIQGKHFSEFESVFKGAGMDIDDFRTYSPGDSPKHINRKISAKLDQLFVNIFEQEKAIDLDIFLDINYNWRWTAANKDKPNSHIALELLWDILVYARKKLLPTKIYYPHTALFWATKLNELILNKELNQAYVLLSRIPGILRKQKPKHTSILQDFIVHSKKNSKRRAIVIISDFLQIQEQDLRTLSYLHNEHSLHLFRLPVHAHYGQNYEFTPPPSFEGHNITYINL